jgi:hypothetical protein
MRNRVSVCCPLRARIPGGNRRTYAFDEGLQ